jgi:shikimate kinase
VGSQSVSGNQIPNPLPDIRGPPWVPVRGLQLKLKVEIEIEIETEIETEIEIETEFEIEIEIETEIKTQIEIEIEIDIEIETEIKFEIEIKIESISAIITASFGLKSFAHCLGVLHVPECSDHGKHSRF